MQWVREIFVAGFFQAWVEGTVAALKNLYLGIKFSVHTMAGTKSCDYLLSAPCALESPLCQELMEIQDGAVLGPPACSGADPRECLNSHIFPSRAWKGYVFWG